MSIIDHDRLFKEVLSTFLAEFLSGFYGQAWQQIEPNSLELKDKELFTDVTSGQRYAADLVVLAKLKNGDRVVLHVEHTSSSTSNFDRRMFLYFSRLHEKYACPVFQIVVCSFDTPQRAERDRYRVKAFGRTSLILRYNVLQLNRLHWRDFVSIPNPVTCAFAAKMKMARSQRPIVKLECLRTLSQLGLNPARTQLVSGFIDTYLKLNAEEETIFRSRLQEILPEQQEEVMQIVTTWMEQGIEDN